MLIVTSSDCYCSIITFEPNELGIPLEPSVFCLPMQETHQVTKSSDEMVECSNSGQAEQTSAVDKTSSVPAPAPAYQEAMSPSSKLRRIRPTMIPTMISTVPNAQTDSTGEVTVKDQAGKTECPAVETVSSSSSSETGNTVTNKKVPRRIELITLSSFTSSDNRTESEVDNP